MNCIISHVADLDGAFPIILGSLVLKDLETYSVELDEVEAVLKKIIEKKDCYEKIYITDLNISEEMAKVIENDETLKEKVLVFDHHISNLFMNKFSFIQVIDTLNGQKECGTTLFYQYLKDHFGSPLLEKPCVKLLTELVRENDTFDFKDAFKEDAFKLGSLYSIYGREDFIAQFIKRIQENETFSFSEVEAILLKIEQERTDRYIKEKLSTMKKCVIHGIKVGLCFAESHRSLLGHEMCRDESIDLAVIINVNRSVSYRANKEAVDVNDLAFIYGGGGHKHAGGSPLPQDFLKKISEAIFGTMEWEDET